MPSEFSKLLQKSKEEKQQTENSGLKLNLNGNENNKSKPNPFAALSDTIAKQRKEVAPTPNTLYSRTHVNPTETDAGSEKKSDPASSVSADEFNSPDQPENYNQDAIDELNKNLQILKDTIDDKHLVTEALRSIMIHMQKHPFLKDILLPEDCQLMTRSLRNSYQKIITIKTQRKEKKSKNQEDVDKVLKDLSSLEIDI